MTFKRRFDPTSDPGTGMEILSVEAERKRDMEGIRPEWIAGREKRLALAEQAREYPEHDGCCDICEELKGISSFNWRKEQLLTCTGCRQQIIQEGWKKTEQVEKGIIKRYLQLFTGGCAGIILLSWILAYMIETMK